MGRTVKHFSLHRIVGTRPAGVELRVVADVESGVLPVIQVEEAVIREYARQKCWSHRWVTLYVLEDLQPLIRQLRLGAASASLDTVRPSLSSPTGGWLAEGHSLSPQSLAALDHRSVVNVYDLADLTGCNVFVNRQAMVEQSYWDDPLALRGLLAHEHAHPLAENETAHASRQLKFQISDLRFRIEENPQSAIRNPQSKIVPVLTSLAEKLCLYAPREIFANEMAIQSGFEDGLLHLNQRNVDNASRSVAGRDGLVQQLHREISRGNLTPEAADLLLLIGDLSGSLDLVLEVAPFYRAGRAADARSLETTLQTAVFPYLDPLVPQTFATLRDQYIALRADLTGPELLAWGRAVLDTLTGALAEKGMALAYRLSLTVNGPVNT